MRKNLDYWKSIDASPFVLDIISSGYKIPFIEKPPCAKFENNKSAPDSSEFVNEALEGFISGIDPLELLHILYLVCLCDVT